MPKWIHDRAEHILAKNPDMPKSQAFAVATQQSHALGKSPKGYGTEEGRETAEAKYKTPGDDRKTANPGGLKSEKLSFAVSQYSGGLNPVIESGASHLPPFKAPNLKTGIQKVALLERLVRLGATDIPGTPRMFMRQRSPEELAQLQHGVTNAFQKVEEPVKRVVHGAIDKIPSEPAKKVLKGGANLLIENPETIPMQAVPIPGLTPAYLAAKKGLEKGIDHVAPLPGKTVLAAATAEEEKPGLVAPAVVTGLGGTIAAAHAPDSLASTLGYQRFHHGTSNEAAENIRRVGLDPRFGGGANGASRAVGNPDFVRESRNRIHVTPNKTMAGMFARIAERSAQSRAKGERLPPEEGMRAMSPFSKQKGSVLTGAIPYKDFVRDFSPDPDTAGIGFRSPHKLAPEVFQTGLGSIVRNAVKNPRQVLEHVKAHPKYVGNALANVALPTAAAVGGGLWLKNNLDERSAMSQEIPKFAELFTIDELAELLKEAADLATVEKPPAKKSIGDKAKGVLNDVKTTAGDVASKVQGFFGKKPPQTPPPDSVNVGQWWETKGGEYLKNNPGDLKGFKKLMEQDGIPEGHQRRFMSAAERISSQNGRGGGGPRGPSGRGPNMPGFSMSDADFHFFTPGQQKAVNYGAMGLAGAIGLHSAVAPKREDPNTEVPEWKGRLGSGIEMGVPGAFFGYAGGKILRGLGKVRTPYAGPLGAAAGAGLGALVGQGAHAFHKFDDKLTAEFAVDGDDPTMRKDVKNRASLTESAHRGLDLLGRLPAAGYSAYVASKSPVLSQLIPAGTSLGLGALSSVGAGMRKKYHAANTYKQMQELEKEGAGAPTRGGFMMASDLPPFQAPRLDKAIQKEGDMLGDYVTYSPGDFKKSKYAAGQNLFYPEGDPRRYSITQPFEGHSLDGFVKKGNPTTPMGVLSASKGVGLPKVTAPTTPSIAQQSKPKGFGTPMSGAIKGKV